MLSLENDQLQGRNNISTLCQAALHHLCVDYFLQQHLPNGLLYSNDLQIITKCE